VRFWTVTPASYAVPTDAPVGDMLRVSNRHAMRPGHLHVMAQKAGFDTLITHVFVRGDEYLDSDAVFGVRRSCIGEYVRHEAGTAPDGTVKDTIFFTLDHTLRLAPAISGA